MNEERERKIETTLRSLDGLQRAAAGPFLYAKIKNRERVVEKPASPLWPWSVAIGFCLLLLVNATVVLKGPEETTPPIPLSILLWAAYVR